MRYLVDFHVMQNAKKITAIKDIRAATGMGLAQTKDYVENRLHNTLDSFGGPLICNEAQVARLTELDVNSRDIPAFGISSEPTYAIVSIRALNDTNAIDISGNSLHNF